VRRVEEGGMYEKRVGFITECEKLTSTVFENSFASRLQGLHQPPYSTSSPPYIRRDYGVYPLGLQFLQELSLVQRNRLHPPSALVRPASSIDFLPLSQTHIPQCNSLLHRLFWPGINLLPHLGPKLGIVALYRKLVIGTGILTPDGYLMYLAVRPYWDAAGIGRMMLWWLVRENEHVDITLHCAADNPALVCGFGDKS
jgi:hypothetical protein